MVAVGAIQPVFSTSPSCIQRIKEKAIWIWEVVVLTVKTAGEKVSFVAFRIFEWFSPQLATKIEVGFLYLKDIFNSVRNARRERETQAELTRLTNDNRALHQRIAQLAPLAQAHPQLRQERDRLHTDNQQLNQQAQNLQQQLQLLLGQREQATRQHRAFADERHQLGQERDFLTANNRQLDQRLAESQRELCAATGQIEQLRRDLGQATQQAPQLQRELETVRSQLLLLRDHLYLEKAVKQLPTAPEKQTEIDHTVDILVPLYCDQLNQHRENLRVNQQQASKADQVVFASADRDLGDIIDLLNKIPDAIRRHSQWNHHNDELVRVLAQTTVGV